MNQREPQWQPGERERAMRRCREALAEGTAARDVVMRFGHRLTQDALSGLTSEQLAERARLLPSGVRREGGRLASAIAKHRAR